MTIDVRPIASPDDDPVGFAGVVQLYQDDLAVRDPGDPPAPASEVAAELFTWPADQPGHVFLATIGDRAAGTAWTAIESGPDDARQVSFVEILVADDLRRQGVATALMRELVPVLRRAGQHSVVAYPCTDIEHDAAVALCARYGLTKRQEERCSRVRVDDIDDELMNEWEAAAQVRAPGYRIEQWEGLCPDHLADAWCTAAAGMEDAPLDDVELDHFTRNVEQQRALDEGRRSSGYRLYRTLALAPDGQAAGLSALYIHRDRPQVGHQGDTAVLAAHRGHAIGRWLKAANYRHVRAAHPELGVIETYNAQSNPWMLDINIAMGFRPHRIYTAYQGSLDDIAARLEE